MYLVGEPIFTFEQRDRFHVPAGQSHLNLNVMGETSSWPQIQMQLRKEFLAIAFALQELGVDFRIIYAHADLIDKPTLGACLAARWRMAGFGPNFFYSAMTFPRDFATTFSAQKVVLLSPVTQVVRPEKNGWLLVNSPFGEGGNILYSSDTAVACSRVWVKDMVTRLATATDVNSLTERGMKVVFFPPPLMGFIKDGVLTDRFALNTHVDRAAALIKDKSGFLHLLLDPTMMAGKVTEEQIRHWEPMTASQVEKMLRQPCKEVGIKIHIAPQPKVPCGLNFLQFPDGRILMSSGDAELKAFVRSFVGQNKVYTTEVPIRYYPTYLYGGIRCLVAESPTPLLNPIVS